jgi:hypothetical protein
LAITFPGFDQAVPAPPLVAPVPASIGPIGVGPTEEQVVEDARDPEPPWQIDTPVVVGTALNVKEDALVPVPAGVVTLIVPVVPAPGVAVIWVDEFTVYEPAFVPPKVTAVAPVKLVPMITAEVENPQPLDGVKLVIVGGGT